MNASEAIQMHADGRVSRCRFCDAVFKVKHCTGKVPTCYEPECRRALAAHWQREHRRRRAQ